MLTHTMRTIINLAGLVVMFALGLALGLTWENGQEPVICPPTSRVDHPVRWEIQR